MESSAEDIKSRCALCKTMECCPEHCCNWDTCKCSDCEYCRANGKNKAHQETDTTDLTNPGVFIKSTGAEERTRVGTAKKDKFVNKWAKDDSDDNDEQPEMLHEQYRTQDGALIKNYEIATNEKQTTQSKEDDGKINYAGGVRGIRALRRQRENMPDVTSDEQQEVNQLHNINHNKKQKQQKDEESKR